MRRVLAFPLILGMAAVALAGCKVDSDERGETKTDPQDQFGRVFAAAFNAPESADPIDPRPGDAGPLTLTGDPIDF